MSLKTFVYRVNTGEEGRLDKFLSEKLKPLSISRQQIVESIKSGNCTVNNEKCTKPSFRVKEKDTVKLEIEVTESYVTPVEGKLDIVWRDQDILIINKPPGLSVHPASLKDKNVTLVHHLISFFPDLKETDQLRPGIVHRLDKDTSGLMMIGLNRVAQTKLMRSLSRREILKEYLAVVYGTVEPLSSQITRPIGRSKRNRKKMEITPDGKEAKTIYEVIHNFENNCSLVRIKLLTGRTHQIRVHFSSIGHPVLGDEMYGKKELLNFKKEHIRSQKLIKRQLLHSWKLGLIHPRTKKELSFVQPVPKDFFRVILYLFKRVQRVGITGAIGCGKSMLTEFLKEMGAVVWSADEEVNRLYNPHMPGWQAITHYWGDKFLEPGSNKVDKKKLFNFMLNDFGFKKELERIIHPMVEKGMENFFKTNKEKRLAVAEVPLLIEVGWKKRGHFDLVVGVYCKDELRYKWLMEKRKLSMDQIKTLEMWQLNQAQKMKFVDVVVVNPGSEEAYKKVAKNLFRLLQSLRLKKLKTFLKKLKDMNLISLKLTKIDT